MLKLSQPSRLLRARLLAVVIAATALAAVWAQPAGAAASVLYVDNNNPSCSDGGSGTSSVPFCTIGKGASVGTQIYGIVFTILWTAIATFVILFVVKALVGLRPSSQEEVEGLDVTQHGEVVP